MLRVSRLTAEGREGPLSVCCASLSKEEGAESVKKELKFRPGTEAIICFQWICVLAPMIVLVWSELGDKTSEKLSGEFQENGGRWRS